MLKALKIFEKELGKNHPDTKDCYNSLSYIYKAQGDKKKAKKYKKLAE